MVNDKKSKKDIEEQLLEKLESLNYILNKNRVLDLIELTGNTKKYFIRNFLS